MHVIVWEFRVRKGREAEFEQAYGPTGEWTALFKRGEGYLGTELLHDTTNRQRYVTIDRWTSPATYEAFRSRWRSEYAAMDSLYEALTEHEVLLGLLAPLPGSVEL
jgi:heme-degrading monooxygenase HmoA